MFGILCTIVIGMTLRRILPADSLMVMGRDAFVVFNIYGHVFSLIAAGSTVIRRRDRIILIQAATILWGIFAAENLASEMVLFLVFASLMTLGVLTGRKRLACWSKTLRVLLTAAMTAISCGVGGLVYHGLHNVFAPSEYAFTGSPGIVLVWGFALGFAVGLGIALGTEVVEWMMRKAE
jgi:hypothetical protein